MIHKYKAWALKNMSVTLTVFSDMCACTCKTTKSKILQDERNHFQIKRNYTECQNYHVYLSFIPLEVNKKTHAIIFPT